MLSGDAGAPFIRPDPPYTTTGPGDLAAQRALDHLHDALRRISIDVPLAQGDVLVLDNYRIVHGRRPFSRPLQRQGSMAPKGQCRRIPLP
jgi:L-asparagine oxygenase